MILGCLFKRLHSLLRIGQNSMHEDLLTEVFAEIFKDTQILIDFINKFIHTELNNPQSINITTQKTFLRLNEHETNSRPDLVIQLSDSDKKYIFFFENKLNSGEGHTQLKRYAEHLEVYKYEEYFTFLIYITKYDDPKKPAEIFINDVTAKFIRLRWYKIYNWLKNDYLKGNRDTYVYKVIEFMEEMGLNGSRRFLPQDMYAIQEMNRLQHMMDECLDGIVDQVMSSKFGRATGWSNRSVQLRDHQRYFKANDQGNCSWVGCGFKITQDEYPLVSVLYEIAPNCQRELRIELIDAIHDFIKNSDDWKEYNLDVDNSWAGVVCEKYLLDFLTEEDHIIAIQSFFVDKLKELSRIKEKHPG